MPKKLFFILLFFIFQKNVFAKTDLIHVFHAALISDPTYQQAISQRLSTREGESISLSSLLPNVSLSAETPSSASQRGYLVNLNLSQTVFDFKKFYGLASSHELSKGADAILNVAMQNLILRVAENYFTILKDQDNLIYIQSTKLAYQKQLEQIKQLYQVGLKTLTDVHTARASYETALANSIAAETTLENDKEQLRIITGLSYSSLKRLRDDFPLTSPKPQNINEWIEKAGKQNWSVKALQYQTQSFKDMMKQQFSGHLPTINVQGTYQNNYFAGSNTTPFQTHASSASLNFTFPLFSGGSVVAETNQAKYNYQTASQQLEFELRSTLAKTRQNYLNVIADISKIAADKQSIKANIHSLAGMQESYKVGTETLVNVLTQQQNVYSAQLQYATDRYAYIKHLLALKEAAGTLSEEDLVMINAWLN